MNFFAELKRRNVVRVGVVYLIAAWLVAQIADLVLDNIESPAWVMQTLMLVLALGFPFALIFAWAFELTPEGIKKEKDVDRSKSITPKTGHALDRSIIVVLVIALGYFAWHSNNPGQDATTPVISPNAGIQVETPETQAVPEAKTSAKSIAVLPFVNMSSDPEQEFFSDGISEEILNALAKVKELKVAGRTSSFAFKGKAQDLRVIGEALGVANILEGSVRKSGNKIRITAQLIQVNDGFHLWSETYDRELDDVFVIQDEIASAILEQLKAALMGQASEPVVVAAARTDSEVYDQYLLARQRIYERKRFSIESAADLLDKAIAKDPAYAPAYAQRGIAALLLSEYSYGNIPEAEAETQAKLYLDKALQLDPNQAEAWAGMGLYHENRPGEYPQAIEALEKSLAINPNLIDASNWLQIAYAGNGDNVRALQILEDMMERDPLYPPGFNNTILLYNMFGQQEKSWAMLEKIRPFVANNPQFLSAESRIWLSQGNAARALPLLESAIEQQPNDSIIRVLLSVALIWTGQNERVVEVGSPWFAAAALVTLNRPEEALTIARELAGEGDPTVMIEVLDRTGQQQQLVEFVESRWPDLAAFERENPDNGRGYDEMLYIAHAYSVTGNETRFSDAMARVRAAHDVSRTQGVAGRYFYADEARYYLLSGDPEQAIDLLAQAVDQGFVQAVPFAERWPEMSALAGDPRFEAIQAQMLEHMNAERAELGLEPLST